MNVSKVVSGGQTGVDRGALDAAIYLGIPHGGWCPRGRLAEDGPIPERYQLTETTAPQYAVRTEHNVRDSDATLILYAGELSGGTKYTHAMTVKHGKPVMLVDFQAEPSVQEVRDWLIATDVSVLNVAGPRESSLAGVSDAACAFLVRVLDLLG